MEGEEEHDPRSHDSRVFSVYYDEALDVLRIVVRVGVAKREMFHVTHAEIEKAWNDAQERKRR